VFFVWQFLYVFIQVSLGMFLCYCFLFCVLGLNSYLFACELYFNSSKMI